ncbi:MAG: enolase C-terminal domain-like protein [Pirellulaceae bacterium]
MRPMRAIRDAFGDQVEIMLDGDDSSTACRSASQRPCEIDPSSWKMSSGRTGVDTIADFRRQAEVPLAVSEMMIGMEDYRLVLEKHAMDYIMIDPTWVGGISQTRRICDSVQSYNVPVVMHDCTGPLTLLSECNAATARTNVAWQETVRSQIRMLYPKLIAGTIQAEAGTGACL